MEKALINYLVIQMACVPMKVQTKQTLVTYTGTQLNEKALDQINVQEVAW